jgi:hypothetical protein
VKNLAEKPFIRNMAVRLDAMTGSSSTTKMREPDRGDTWGLFRVFLRVRQGCRRQSRVSVFLGLTRILFTIAHVSGSPTRCDGRRSAPPWRLRPATPSAVLRASWREVLPAFGLQCSGGRTARFEHENGSMVRHSRRSLGRLGKPADVGTRNLTTVFKPRYTGQ